ncbi:alpha/beta fold hydrolase [Pseudonocardia eucalypti]|uniref:Alpha/beta fold hydrolase n=1 Tax=Pseudonocardia eucalypti TaxID=648755 RepID=A0ABP9PQP2_9PSEU|nr:pimeloyl-ACP methyl ester carboxylesterase [Pseudonocardia eucalypti]
MTRALTARSVDGPAGHLAVTVSGDLAADEPVLLVHPINSAAGVWTRVMALLDRPAVALDLRGHGRSVLSGPYTVDGYAADALAVLDALGVRRAHLAGGSLGGSISLAVAAARPELATGVTTFGSTLGTGVPASAIEAMVAELVAKGTERYFADLVPDIVGAAYRANDEVRRVMREAVGTRSEAVIADILRGAFDADIRAVAGRVRAPVHAVGGTEDPTCPPAMTEEIAAATGGRVTLLEGIGHLPMLEVPGRVAELLREDLSR